MRFFSPAAGAPMDRWPPPNFLTGEVGAQPPRRPKLQATQPGQQHP